MSTNRYKSRQEISLPAGSVESTGETWIDTTYPYGDGPWSKQPLAKRYTYVDRYAKREELWDQLHPGPPYKTGGPLNKYLFKSNGHESCGSHTTGLWFNQKAVITKHFATTPPEFWLDWTYSTFKSTFVGKYLAEGATGWNKASPTKPEVEVGVALAELRELPRMLMTTAKSFAKLWREAGGHRTDFGPKHVADNWLNYQFGWLPFLSDLRDFYSTCKSFDKAIKQLYRDNGKWVRRARSVRKDSETKLVLEDKTPLFPVVSTWLYAPTPGYRSVYKTTSESVWFKGSFRYYIPGKPDSWQWKTRAIATLFGLYPTPSLIWELTPWSWLIDWVSNAGDVISNISQMLTNDLCARYAYVMATSGQHVDLYQASYYNNGTVSGLFHAFLERKCRYAASPFGFGLTGESFTARQWSILGALGFSRLESYK